MGIVPETASIIIGASKHSPLNGRVLVCGRQSVMMTPQETFDLVRQHGVVPSIAASECEVDHETRIGGEGKDQRGGEAISDRSFFRMLGVTDLVFLDHSDYEGASIIVDLNEPLTDGSLVSAFDFIIDGGTLDNVWNPSQAMMNFVRMLRPDGRLLTYNLYSNHYTPYTMLPQQWYLDYFAANRFSAAQVYFCVHEFNGNKSYYQVNLAKRASIRGEMGNFPIVDATVTVGSVVYATKGERSTWERQPSQEIYRSDGEWSATAAALQRFADNAVLPIVRSEGVSPIELPGGDDFEYITPSGDLVTEATRGSHDDLLRGSVLQNLITMDERRPDAPWGLIETGKLFFDLIAESAVARAILAKPNVLLFDTRMLNRTIDFDGVTKQVYPAAAATLLTFPMLVISDKPALDVFWKRASHYFRHMELLSACDHKLSNFAVADVYLSPSLESGSYQGEPLLYAPEIMSLVKSITGSA